MIFRSFVDQNPPHRSLVANLELGVAAVALGRRKVGEVRLVTFLGVDDRQPHFTKGGLELGDDRDAWLDILDVVAEQFSKSAPLAKVPLHVDADQGDVVDTEFVREWLRVDFRHVSAVPVARLGLGSKTNAARMVR